MTDLFVLTVKLTEASLWRTCTCTSDVLYLPQVLCAGANESRSEMSVEQSIYGFHRRRRLTWGHTRQKGSWLLWLDISFYVVSQDSTHTCMYMYQRRVTAADSHSKQCFARVGDQHGTEGVWYERHNIRRRACAKGGTASLVLGCYCRQTCLLSIIQLYRFTHS